MSLEEYVDDRGELGCEAFWGWRCILCGAIEDPVIASNRVRPPMPDRRKRKFSVRL
jgi:hypothetical protein